VADKNAAPANGTGEKKKRKSNGPRKMKPTYLLYKGDNVDVVGLTRDAFEILAKTQSEPGIRYVDVSQFLKKEKAPAA